LVRGFSSTKGTAIKSAAQMRGDPFFSCRGVSTMNSRKGIFRSTVQGEAHCNECGVAFFDGDQAYCMEDDDGSLIWFCEEHVPQEPEDREKELG
jgi:hypothetical protein